MINTSGSAPPAWRRWWGLREHWENPSPTARHYGHVSVAIMFFFAAQLLTCAWDQPFWSYNIDFPGQIVAMVFVWLFLWAVQLAFFRPGEGLERFYHRSLRAPVSYRSTHRGVNYGCGIDTDERTLIQTEVLNKHMSIGFTVPFLNLISQSFAGGNQVGLLTTAFGACHPILSPSHRSKSCASASKANITHVAQWSPASSTQSSCTQ